MAGKLGVDHQVCQFHVRRWVGRTLHHLLETVPKEWLWVLEEVQRLLAEQSPQGSHRPYQLWKQIPGRISAPDQPRLPLEQLRDLLIRLSEHWASYRLFDWQKSLP